MGVLIEIASKISTTSSQTTFPITNYAHTHALTTHPLIPLLLTTTSPNCCLQPLLIPDPHPHIRLFLTSLTTIPPYTALSIRPPPQPPPNGMKLPRESKNKECSRGKDGREEVGREDPEQSSGGSVTAKGKEYNDVLANAQYRPCPCLPLL